MFLGPSWYNVIFLLIILFWQKRRMKIFFSIGIILIFLFNWYHLYISFIWLYFSFGIILAIFQLVSIHSIFLYHFFLSSLFNFVKGGEKCTILNDILYPHLSIYWGGEIWEISKSINIWLRGSIMNNCTHSLSIFTYHSKLIVKVKKGEIVDSLHRHPLFWI